MSGSQLRYNVYAGDRLVALLSFGASAWKLAARDTFIGWHSAQRLKNLHLVVNNARFLILPWIQCKGLASKILSIVNRQLPIDWQQRYGFKPVLLETFVECERCTRHGPALTDAAPATRAHHAKAPAVASARHSTPAHGPPSRSRGSVCFERR